MVKYSGSPPRLRFTDGGRGLAVPAGARLLADLADNTDRPAPAAAPNPTPTTAPDRLLKNLG